MNVLMNKALPRLNGIRQGVWALLCLMGVLALPAAAAGQASPKLVHLGLERAPGVPEDVHFTLEEATANQLGGSLHGRGWRQAPLRQVSGLEEQAKSCRARGCRAEIAGRLKASHIFFGRVERAAKGYRLSLWLERAHDGAFVRAVRLEGRVLELVGDLPDHLDGIFESVSPKEAISRERLAKTARAYAAKGRTADAARTLQRAIALNAFHPDAAKLAVERLELLEGAADEAAAEAALSEVIEMYGPRSAWTMGGIADEATRDFVLGALKEHFARVGTQKQREADRLMEAATDDAGRARAATLRSDAEASYRRYLELFPDDNDAGEMELYLAELLFARGDFIDAAAHYESILEMETRKDIRQQGALGAVYALEKEWARAVGAGEAHGHDLESLPSPPETPSDLDPAEKAFVGAVDRLAESFGDLDEVAAFAYRAAQLYVLHGDETEGAHRLETLVKRWPRSAAAKVARRARGQLGGSR
jgi:tetratricopeptide (TPR) repeat protein